MDALEEKSNAGSQGDNFYKICDAMFVGHELLFQRASLNCEEDLQRKKIE